MCMNTERPKQKIIGFRVTGEFLALIERLAETLSVRRKCRTTKTAVLVEAVVLLAKQEKVQ